MSQLSRALSLFSKFVNCLVESMASDNAWSYLENSYVNSILPSHDSVDNRCGWLSLAPQEQLKKQKFPYNARARLRDKMRANSAGEGCLGGNHHTRPWSCSPRFSPSHSGAGRPQAHIRHINKSSTLQQSIRVISHAVSGVRCRGLGTRPAPLARCHSARDSVTDSIVSDQSRSKVSATDMQSVRGDHAVMSLAGVSLHQSLRY